MATKHHDSKRTSRSHEQSIQRRISTHEKNLDRHLADRAFKRLMAEFNQKTGTFSNGTSAYSEAGA